MSFPGKTVLGQTGECASLGSSQDNLFDDSLLDELIIDDLNGVVPRGIAVHFFRNKSACEAPCMENVKEKEVELPEEKQKPQDKEVVNEQRKSQEKEVELPEEKQKPQKKALEKKRIKPQKKRVELSDDTQKRFQETEVEPSEETQKKPLETPCVETVEEDEIVEHFEEEKKNLQKTKLNLKPNVVIKQVIKGSRKYDKVRYCYYCFKAESNKMSRHFDTFHKNESLVLQASIHPAKSPERRKQLTYLTRLGDFHHNMEVLQKGEGELVVLKRTSEEEKNLSYSDYGPCPECHGFAVLSRLFDHVKVCPLAKSSSKRNFTDEEEAGERRQVLKESRSILIGYSGTSDTNFNEKVLNNLLSDELGSLIREDELIKQFGLYKYRKANDMAKYEYIRQDMRQLARLLRSINSIRLNNSAHPVQPLPLSHFINAENFDLVVDAVLLECQFRPSEKVTEKSTFGTPSMALKLGYHLQRCAQILQGQALRKYSKPDLQRYKGFLKLYENEWCERVSSNALGTFAVRHKNRVEELPLTEDVKAFSNSLDGNLMKAITEFEQNPSKETYRQLIYVCSAKLTTFNKQRSGIAGRLLLSDWKARPKEVHATDEFLQTLSSLEKRLCKVYQVVQVDNKRKGHVWLIVPTTLVKGIEMLVEYRCHEEITKFINPENPFVFPIVDGNSLNSIRGDKCVTYLLKQTNIKRPELLSARAMRKYTATVIQYLNLPKNQMSWVTKHLGHNLDVHLTYYRQHETALEIAKVSKLLLAIDSGNLVQFKGKNLDDITLDEIPLNISNIDEDKDEEEIEEEEEEEEEDDGKKEENETTEKLDETNGTHEEKDEMEEEDLALDTYEPTTSLRTVPRTRKPLKAIGNVRDECQFPRKRQKEERNQVKITGASRSEAAFQRRPWSQAEENSILEYFRIQIRDKTCIGKGDAEACISQYGSILKSRRWQDIKYKVKNLQAVQQRAIKKAKEMVKGRK
nr:PREDICTED: uncharacterized protein LOC109030598 [Bemisia tabaci]